MKCWGANADGQLGNGVSGARELVPVDVDDIEGAVALAAGDDHTCAILRDGSLRCWGDGFLGELGDNRLLSSSLPVVVSGVSDVRSAAGGLEHTCAVSNGGTVWCWGKGLQGQLGIGTPLFAKAPVAVNVSDGRDVATGDAFSCASLAHGAKCWGANDHGQLGNGQFGGNVPTPVDVGGL